MFSFILLFLGLLFCLDPEAMLFALEEERVFFFSLEVVVVCSTELRFWTVCLSRSFPGVARSMNDKEVFLYLLLLLDIAFSSLTLFFLSPMHL